MYLNIPQNKKLSIRICICDDDKNLYGNLKDMILQHDTHVITVFHSAEELLFECENQFSFECVFLDIQMKSMNGIDCARKIREYDKKVGIVFLSVIKDYVFEGYEVKAIRYLLKPLETGKCHALLDLISESVTKERQYLFVNKTFSCGLIISGQRFLRKRWIWIMYCMKRKKYKIK